ncbi:hypothetical protein [Desulfosporosinus nitroreducens]|uniref:Transposase n=1 Tax=Desulfosporosinus nitroreducens TaxID=2018668 RepID=A0ABT8QQC0_9FIRM|nr:hypothetical protein [Desulfosporosinus nitroreducens]MDO0822106.1 hypothetical protein [Desulfosporosinus nitroreducens]
MDSIVIRVKELYQERRKETQDNIGPIKKEIKEVESTIENWMQALGKGIKGLRKALWKPKIKLTFSEKNWTI